MERLHLKKSGLLNSDRVISITGSKSESNRLLLLQALYKNINIKNLSQSDDTVVMQNACTTLSNIIDIHHAGTAMRFLTAFFSIQQGQEVILTGSSRMKERPIHVLVDALNQLGAQIEYLGNEGYPPLKITGTELKNHKVKLQANISSQYISALLLIAPKLKNGLELHLQGDITSRPYLNMTLNLLKALDVKISFKGQMITVYPKPQVDDHMFVVESDWSSASYFYSLVALSPLNTQITLTSYKANSLQGDSCLKDIYEDFGVKTIIDNQRLTLTKVSEVLKNYNVNLNLMHAPDIAQTIAVTCLGLGMACNLSGLHTLKIKETDRLLALKVELEKLGAQVNISVDSLQLQATGSLKNNVTIDTYNDHRMAMAFAPLALKTDISINNFKVVSKSYPNFWNDLKTIGIKVSK